MKFARLTRARASIFGVLTLALILSIAAIALNPLIATPATATLTPTARPTDLGATLVTKRTFPSLSYGIHTFLWWNPTTRPRDLESVRLMRFDYVKQIFDWNDVRADRNQPNNWERADAVIQEAQYRNIKVIARLGKPPYWVIRQPPFKPEESPYDLQAFGEFCRELATRYKGKIAGYQVWNEPNLAREWAGQPPSPAGYVAMLKVCYQAIKAADPDAAVISAGLAPTATDDNAAMPDERFLVEMYKLGSSQYYDVLGLNAPGYKSSPETPPDDPSLNGQRWQAFRHVEDMRAIMVANGDGKKQVALLEVGWTVDQRDTINNSAGTSVPNPYRWHAVTEEQQAKYLPDAYEYAAKHWRPWVGLIVAIYLPDPGWTPDDEEYWWSVSYPGYVIRHRESFVALAQMAQYRDDVTIPAIGHGMNHTPLPPPVTPTPPAQR